MLGTEEQEGRRGAKGREGTGVGVAAPPDLERGLMLVG